ncbi:3-oxoadipate enol-lactonase [Tepidamorphus gemmatus]|uniref:3-oxoadipate enol-lactonase n=1 Tax=Tepidamorphus gemmatus TaxID=747076 RepID=A0A4V2UZV7_9HYPH|nr:3-oxoadipate enol-lactonase [Tepidamorphus gemmatus]TCT12703.1 3-oxoadipate enol-lactonase [Tepidamorphus gemmatus]
MPHIEADGTRIYHEISGSAGKPWLVLSNSLGTRLEMWDGQAAALADDFRILRYDSRGHGRSDAPAGNYTIERLGRDVLTLLDALGIARARFCGLSMGGMVGMWLGINAPDRLDRLVLCNTGARLGPPELWSQRIEAVASAGMAAVTDAVIERWFTPEFRAARPDKVAPVRRMLLDTPAAGYAGCCAAIRDMDQREAVTSIRIPTLVIGGSRDPATPASMAEELASSIPGARLSILEAAHLSNIEQEEAFNDTVSTFLRA